MKGKVSRSSYIPGTRIKFRVYIPNKRLSYFSTRYCFVVCGARPFHKKGVNHLVIELETNSQYNHHYYGDERIIMKSHKYVEANKIPTHLLVSFKQSVNIFIKRGFIDRDDTASKVTENYDMRIQQIS